jgi:FkbM family methyltransferase
MRIYAFEANPDTYRRLIESLPDNVQARQIAISDRSGTLEFIDGAVSHVFTTIDHASGYNIKGRTSMVPSCRLDECEIEGDSLIIKIDVEGQEMDVLKGAIGLFEAMRVKAVYLDGYEDPGVGRYLEGFGFRLFDGRTLEPVSGKVFSLLAIHPARHSEMFAS